MNQTHWVWASPPWALDLPSFLLGVVGTLLSYWAVQFAAFLVRLCRLLVRSR